MSTPTTSLANLPPGPEYYEARRALWLTPKHDLPPKQDDSDSSSSRRQLDYLLSQPNAVLNDDVWRGLERVWKGFAGGGRLKRRLPLKIVIQIVYGAWLRDNTWPAGQMAPELDDVAAPIDGPPSTAVSSGTTESWIVGTNNSSMLD